MIDAISTRLYWLDIPARVVFELHVLAFRFQHGSAPPYLAVYFIPVGAIEGQSSGYQPIVCSMHQNCDNRPTGIHS